MKRRMRPLVQAALGIVLLGSPTFAEDVSISSNFISEFKPGSDTARFGNLEFLGGIEMASNAAVFGGWSGIRLRPDQTHFVGVLDTGDWITGAIVRDAEGRLSTISGVSVNSMHDARGRVGNSKWRVDSESLALDKGRILVGFERNFRIDAYPDPGFENSKPIASLDIIIPKSRLVENRSTETVAISPADGPLAGSPVTVMEDSVNQDGNFLAAVLSGPRKGVFAVKKLPPYEVTDGTFLPDGDLLILERRFGLTSGIGMRLRRLKTADIKPGATVDGEVVMEADGGHQIDNMEGIDSFLAADGSTHVILVSDDNFSLLQRNLMLEFRLVQ